MKCPYCGQEHSDNARFCENTGKPLGLACSNPDCPEYDKYVLPPEAKFCPRCGKPLAATSEQTNAVSSHVEDEEEGKVIDFLKLTDKELSYILNF